MRTAIKIAIENGWDYHGSIEDYISKLKGMEAWEISADEDRACLEPRFWQALGKGLGWSIQLVEEGNWDDMESLHTVAHDKWKYEMHRFLDHLIAGGDINEFFEELCH